MTGGPQPSERDVARWLCGELYETLEHIEKLQNSWLLNVDPGSLIIHSRFI